MFDKNKKIRILKALVILLELLALALLVYIVVLPFYPEVKYRVVSENKIQKEEAKDIEKVEEKTQTVVNHLPKNQYDVSPHRVIITKIGVNAPIVESASAEYGLSLGAWRVPDSSTPNQGGNTVITGHRFKYLPPSNLTFYLFHKLETGDIVSIIWDKTEYYYRIREVKIVDKTEVSIMNQTEESVLTMFTCHPIYSTEKRLVVVADLIKKEKEIE